MSNSHLNKLKVKSNKFNSIINLATSIQQTIKHTHLPYTEKQSHMYVLQQLEQRGYLVRLVTQQGLIEDCHTLFA